MGRLFEARALTGWEPRSRLEEGLRRTIEWYREHPAAWTGGCARYYIARMSGHSKWASIKHKKAVVDARRGQHFTKLARAITVAAREGGGDPTGTRRSRWPIQKARDASMPKDNIERAIAKGTGEGADADQIETVLYEGYGPGGVALLIEALTDNRNRTGAEMRHLLGKHGGNLGEPGSVSYLFDKRGVIVVDASRYGEDDLMPAIDAGAQDIALDEDVFEVITEPADLTAAREALARGRRRDRERRRDPAPDVPACRWTRRDAAKLMKLIDALEESDDVGAVHANFDVDAAVLERDRPVTLTRRALTPSSLPSPLDADTSTRMPLLAAASRRRRRRVRRLAPRLPASSWRRRPGHPDPVPTTPKPPPAACRRSRWSPSRRGPAPTSSSPRTCHRGPARPPRRARRSPSTTSASCTRTARSSTPRGSRTSRSRPR